jgi:phage shock protein E
LSIEVIFIEAEKLKRMQAMHVRILLFDLRSPEEFSLGHIKGAFNLPKLNFLEKIENQVPIKDTPIVLYSKNREDCVEIAEKIEELKFINVVVLDCGYDAYISAI